uniref:Uncharacterized protein n=1 Tax=Tanacetum cinerariifolium TaxID=118510 RepID=A0A6L2LDU0_TANCI|nr:hypothetical protein [Tanacetum cinerariifolium]
MVKVDKERLRKSKVDNNFGTEVVYEREGTLFKLDGMSTLIELNNIRAYTRLEEEKAHRHGKVYNWETATYGRIWYDDDIHDLRFVETEFPTIAFNDTLTFEVALSCEPTVSSLNDNKTDFRISFNESDDEDYTTNKFFYELILFKTADTALPPRDQRHQYLRFEGLEYTGILSDRVYLLAELGGGYLRFEACWHRMSWREFILGMGLHTVEEIESAGFGAYWADSARQILDKGDMSAYWRGILSEEDFLGTTPSYTMIENQMLRLRHRLIKCSIAGRSHAPKKGLTVIVRDLLVIDMAELVRLQICKELVDTWAWVASRPFRQPDAVAGALKVAEGAPDVDEGAQAIPVHLQAPQPPLVVS